MIMKDVVHIKVFAVAIVAVAVFSLCTAPVSPGNELKKFTSAEQLTEFLQGQNSYGSIGGAVQRETLSAGAPQAADKSGDYSTTNIQVTGVDEADFVKNDGKYIYTISGNSVVITDAYPADSMKILSTINLSGSNPSQIYINDDRLVVFGNVYGYNYGPLPLAATEGVAEKIAADSMPIRYGGSTTYIKIYDVSDRSNPTLARDLEFNGSYYNSRMIGDQVYAILTVPTYGGIVPVFSPYQRGFQEIYYFDMPSYSYQYTNIVSLNMKDDAAEAKNKVFLLGYSTNMYVSQDNIYLAYQKQLGPYYTMEKILDVTVPLLPADVSGEISSIRASAKSNYRKYGEIQLVLQEWMQNNPQSAADILQQLSGKIEQVYNDIYREQDKSVVHRIEINNGDINYIGSGEVPGTPLNQFSMDESNGYFRIATTTTNFALFARPIGVVTSGSGSSGVAVADPGQTAPGSEPDVTGPDQPVEKPVVPTQPSTFNNVYVLDSSMSVVGRLENLAPGERIYSARFVGDRAYLVTFVRMDPLFVIDLSNPTAPSVLGELKIPGVSDYLHPYDATHIIGVGQNSQDIDGRVAFKGLKISLFDVSDVGNPQEIAKYELGGRGTYSEAFNDHKAFLFSLSKNLLVIPVSLYEDNGQSWGDLAWQGAYRVGMDPTGTSVKGRVTHANSTDIWMNQIRRSLYIDNVLYTVSDGKIKANALGDFADISAVDLPREYYYDGPYYAL